jgi:serine/threonine protein kinase
MLDPRQTDVPQADSFAHIEALFTALSARPVAERDQALREIADVPIRERVAALLAAHDRLAANDPDDEVVTGASIGDRIGVYRLVERVGTGGMGDVYRAERADGLYQQQVAVKITRALVGDPDLLRRFSTERQILASLHHPNIVGLLDGGALPSGQAYLIMEYLQGEPLTHYARRVRLPLDARLRLFAAVCAAVQHAHQHAIVHRDLKPANILVGGDGVPKVVDFGIAKLLEAPAGAQATVALWPGPMTPNYASPEQLRGLPVTTASDVYALGVVLYELVAGARPYDTEGQTLDRVIEMVVHSEPPRPSEANGSSDALPYPRARLRGDLDAIVLKAMSKDSSARYPSAAELAADIERWLAGDPVLARARSSAYVLRRLARRHRALVATAAVALLAVLAALGVAAWQWQSARSAQLRAETRFRDVRQLANALIFKIHDAVSTLDGSTAVRRTIVDEAIQYLERLEQDADNDPTLLLELAAAHRQLGAILGNPSVANLGDRPAAITQYERARQLLSPLAGTNDHIDVAASWVNINLGLSSLHYSQGQSDKSIAIAREMVAFVEAYAARNPASPRVDRLKGQALFALASAEPMRDSIATWERTLAHYEGMLAAAPAEADNQRNVALAAKYLGGRLETLRDYAAARTHYARALELDAGRLAAAPDNRSVQFDAAISYSNVASAAQAVGDLAAAGPLFEKSLALRRALAESDPNNMQAADRYAYLLARVAGFHLDNGAPAAALASAREAVSRFEHLHQRFPDQMSVYGLAHALMYLGRSQRANGQIAEACATLGRSRSLYRKGNPQSSTSQIREARFVDELLASCP